MRYDGQFAIDDSPILWSGNYSSYALPIAGGTITGQLILNGLVGNKFDDGIRINNSSVNWSSIMLGGVAGSTDGHNGTTNWFVATNPDSVFMINPINSGIGYGLDLYRNGEAKWRGNTIWHAGNDGSGSGLDADLLDGTHLKSIIGFDTKRDFINGTLITTDIDYSVSYGDPFYLEIKGNAYNRGYPCLTQAQGYIYYDTIINYGVTHLGYVGIFGLIALNVNGRLCFWFPRQGYWEGYSIFVSSAYGTSYNRVIAIDDVAKPAGTKEVIISEHTSTSAFLNSNVASATRLQATRTIWGQSFNGTENVSGDLIMGGTTISGNAGKIFFGGNFHIDSIADNHLFLNFYNSTNIYMNYGTTKGNTLIGGNVGIGTQSPEYKLDVTGTLRATGTVYTNVGVKSRNICIETDNDGNASTNSSEINNFNSTLFLQYQTSNGLAMCAGGGNVSIGTTYNGGYRLYVNGNSKFNGNTEFSNFVTAYNTISVNKNTPNGTNYAELGIQVYSNDGSPVGIGFHRGGYSQTILEHNGDGLTIRSSSTIGTGAYGNLTVNDVTASNYRLSLTNQVRTNSGYLELVSAGDEICVGGNDGIMHVNYRPATNGTPTNWYWRAGSSTSFANFYVGGLVANGVISSSNRIFTGYDSGIANSISCSNWFYSNGNTGWYNATYEGGIWMSDSTYVRVYNNKAFKVDSTASDSITTAGGVTAANFYGNISASYLTDTIANERLPQRLRNYTSQYFVDPNTFKESGFAYTTTNLPANVNDANILSVSHTSGGWGHQLAFKFGGSGIGGSGYDGKDIYTRTYNSGTGTWTSWYGLLSTGNYSNVLDSRYRPMGGGWSGNGVPGTREFG